MLINLLPDFFAVHNSTDRVAAYLRYFENHRRFLEAYWHNYVLDPAGPHFLEVVRSAALASRVDLRTMLERIDVVSLARNTEEQCRTLLGIDTDIDVVLMVGVGAANAGELVVDGKGVAFVCLEHFTSVTNPETQGLGLDPELIPLWLAHEIAHSVRYTSPTSRSELKQLIEDAGGYYSYWETGRRASLRELMINEGLSTHASRAISPGHAAWEYYGYTRREYASVRELEPLMTRALNADLDRAGLGLQDLIETIDEALSEKHGEIVPELPILTKARHRHALTLACSEIEQFLRAWREENLPATIASIHLRTAVASLEELIGTVEVEDVFDRVFSSFCVGK